MIIDRRRGFERVVRVWLPSEAPRAILYLNDGQNLFTDHRSPRTKWRAAETAARMIAARSIVPLAIVGIDHGGGRRRWRDYLPYADPRNLRAHEFEADRFVDFVVGTVMPRLTQLHPELGEVEHTGFGGSSYGAVAAIHGVFRHPGTFERLLIESAAFWVGDGRLMEEGRGLEADRVFIGMGTREWGVDAMRFFGRGTAQRRASELNVELVRLAREFARGRQGRSEVKLVIGRAAPHHESAWSRRFPAALRWLFPRSGRPPRSRA